MIQHSWDGTQKNSSCYPTGSGYDIGHLISESSFQPSESPWTSPMNFYSLQEDEGSIPFDKQRQKGQGFSLQEMPPDSFRPVLVPLLSVQKRTSSLTSLLATDSWISPSTRNDEKRRQQYGDNGSSGMGVTFPEIGGKVLNMALVMSSGRERSDVRRTAVDDYMPDGRSVKDFDELDSLSEDLSERRSLRGVMENTSKNRVRNRDRSYDRAELNSNGYAPTNEEYCRDDTEDFEAHREISGSTWDAQSSNIAQRRQIGDLPLYHRSHSEGTFHEDHSMRIIPVRNQSSASLYTKEQTSSVDRYIGSMCRDIDSEIEEDDRDIRTNSGIEQRGLTYSKKITFHSSHTDGNVIEIGSKVKRKNTAAVSAPPPLISAMRNTAISSTETAVARVRVASSSVCNAMSSDSEDSSDDDDDDEGSSSKNDSIRTDRHFSINHDNKKNNKEKIKSKNATRFNFDLKSTQKTMIERMREKERKGKKGSKKNGKIGVRFKEGKEKENGVVEAHCFSKSPVLSTCTSSSTSTTISSTTSSEKGDCDDFSFLFPTHYPTEREGLTRVGSNIRDPSVPAFTSKHLKSPPISSSFFAHGYGSRCVHESGSGTGSGIESDSGSGSAYGRSCERNRGGGGGGGVEGEKGSGSFFEGILESMGEAILTLFTQKVSSSFSS